MLQKQRINSKRHAIKKADCSSRVCQCVCNDRSPKKYCLTTNLRYIIALSHYPHSQFLHVKTL